MSGKVSWNLKISWFSSEKFCSYFFYQKKIFLLNAENAKEICVQVWQRTFLQIFGGNSGLCFKVCSHMFQIASCIDPPPIPDNLSPAVRDLLLRCLEVNREDRPPAKELLKHPLFTMNSTTTNRWMEMRYWKRGSLYQTLSSGMTVFSWRSYCT